MKPIIQEVIPWFLVNRKYILLFKKQRIKYFGLGILLIKI